MEEEQELQMLLEAQRQELMASRTVESDLDFAFKLQMQETLTASCELSQSQASASCELSQSQASASASCELSQSQASASASSSSSTPPPPSEIPDYSFKYDEGDTYISDLMIQEVENYQRERMDYEQREAEMKKMKSDLEIRLHDRKFAADISRIDENWWREHGDNYHRPFSAGSSSLPESSSSSSKYSPVEKECFRLYFKGLVHFDPGAGILGAFGIAICDSKDNVIVELGKPLIGVADGRPMNGDIAEIEALIEGLNYAVSLDLKRIAIYCDDHMLHQYVSGQHWPYDGNAMKLIEHVNFLRTKFKFCNAVLVAHKDIKFAFQLARSSLLSQTSKPVAGSRDQKVLRQSCAICFEDTEPEMMFTVDACQHRFCFFCIKKHAEVKLLGGSLPGCPHVGCKSQLNVESCRKMVSPRLFDIMSQLLKEDSIPVNEKVYCPNPKCSALMSKAEVMNLSMATDSNVGKVGACECYKCYKLFCRYCMVPWHANMSCHEYMKSNPNGNRADAKLKSLATSKLWRQCVNCKNMVELAEGCYHITCRCSYQFCYTCGAPWKDKKATCHCVLWNERNIIHRQNAGRRR